MPLIDRKLKPPSQSLCPLVLVGLAGHLPVAVEVVSLCVEKRSRVPVVPGPQRDETSSVAQQQQQAVLKLKVS